MTEGFVIQATISIRVPQRGHRSGSTSKTFLIRRAQWARLEVDMVEPLSIFMSVQDGRHAVNAFCDKAFRFRFA